MREKTVETQLARAVKLMGGIAVKLLSPSWAGIPDRLVLLPHGHMAFVELKAPGKHPCPLQVKRKSQLEALGFSVYVIDRPEQIGGVRDEISAT